LLIPQTSLDVALTSTHVNDVKRRRRVASLVVGLVGLELERSELELERSELELERSERLWRTL
jgi:hypothetical protein